MVLVSGVGASCPTIGYHHADRCGVVSHQSGESSQCRTFHLKIGDVQSVLFEAFYLFVLVRVGKRNAQLPALRSEEASACHGDAP